jgi:microcystin-dependent protein
MTLDLQYDLINYTPADSTPVEANFNRTQQYINTELINRAGSVAMTAQLQLVGDPVAALDAAPKQYVDSFVPIAAILMYAGPTAPAGGKWALCNGAELEQAAYPILFGRIGQTYGGTAGHFNLPQLAGRFPLGGGVDALAANGGSRDAIVAPHVHTVDHTHAGAQTTVESVAHSHGVSIQTGGQSNSHYHAEQLGTIIADGGDIEVRFNDGFTFPVHRLDTSVLTTNWAAQDHSHGVNGNTGGQNVNHTHGYNVPTFNGNSGPASGAAASVTNANLPPYLVINFIIRIA